MSEQEITKTIKGLNSIVTTREVEACMFPVRNQQVLIDRDVATLYGVETKRINEAVKNNPDKFPEGYIFELNNEEIESVGKMISSRGEIADENFDRKGISPMSRYTPKAFTERGLYMLATILKSPRATQTTIAIIDTFAKVKELSRHLDSINDISLDAKDKAAHAERTGQLLSELLTDELKKKGKVGIELNMMSVSITQNKN